MPNLLRILEAASLAIRGQTRDAEAMAGMSVNALIHALHEAATASVGYCIIDGQVAPGHMTFRTFAEVQGVTDVAMREDATRLVREAEAEWRRYGPLTLDACVFTRTRLAQDGSCNFSEAYRWDDAQRAWFHV